MTVTLGTETLGHIVNEFYTKKGAVLVSPHASELATRVNTGATMLLAFYSVRAINYCIGRSPTSTHPTVYMAAVARQDARAGDTSVGAGGYIWY